MRRFSGLKNQKGSEGTQVMELLQKSGFQLTNVFDICRSPAPENILVQLDAVYLKKQD